MLVFLILSYLFSLSLLSSFFYRCLISVLLLSVVFCFTSLFLPDTQICDVQAEDMAGDEIQD